MSPDGELHCLDKEGFESFEHMPKEEVESFVKKLKNSKSVKQTKAIRKAKKQKNNLKLKIGKNNEKISSSKRTI